MAVTLPPGVYRRDIAQKFPSYVAVATQTSLPDGITLDAVSDSLNSRMKLISPTGASITDLVLSYPQFSLNIPEADFGVTYTVTAAIEYPAGTFTPVWTAAGSRSLEVVPGRGLVSFQPCPITIPAGTPFWIKTYATWTPGNFFLSQHAASWISGDGTARGAGLTDDTLVAGTPTTTSVHGFGPTVYGRLSTPTAVLGVIGDSIAMTATEAGEPTTNWSFLERAMRGVIPVLNTARNSDSMALYLQRYDGRAAALRDSITDLWMTLGRNDLGSYSVATMQANYQKIINPFLARGVKVWGNTITPYVTSTDGYITTANQTIVSSGSRETHRVEFNQWLRDNWRSLGLSGLSEWARTMDPTDSGKWSFDGSGLGRSAQGFATLTGGAVSAVAMGSFLATSNSGGQGYALSTTTPCAVLNYPGTPGSGAQVTGNTNGSGLVTTYTVDAGGSGYTYPPMVSPWGSWTNDGIHPDSRGYDLIISECGIKPEMFVL